MGGAARPNIVHAFDFLLITNNPLSHLSLNPLSLDRPMQCNFSLITLIRPGKAVAVTDVCIVHWWTPLPQAIIIQVDNVLGFPVSFSKTISMNI